MPPQSRAEAVPRLKNGCPRARGRANVPGTWRYTLIKIQSTRVDSRYLLPRMRRAHDARQDAPAPGRIAGDPGVLLIALQAGRNEGAGVGSIGPLKSSRHRSEQFRAGASAAASACGSMALLLAGGSPCSTSDGASSSHSSVARRPRGLRLQARNEETAHHRHVRAGYANPEQGIAVSPIIFRWVAGTRIYRGT